MASYDDTATVSGIIVRVNDGADSVPLKNWLVTLPASLSGYSAIGFNKGGANFIELYTRASHNGVDYSINADGSLHRYGTASGNSFNNGNATNYLNCPFKLRAGTYTLSVSGSGDNTSFTSLGIYLASGASFTAQGITGNGTKTFTVSEDFGAWFYIKTNSGVTVNDDVYIWLSAGSTADAYAPYVAPTTSSVSLGRTIYGGTADVVKGEGEATFSYHKITADDEIALYPSANGFRIPTAGWASGAMVNQANSGGLCNILPTVTVSTGQGVRFGMNNDQIYMVQCYDIFGSTVESFKTYVTNNDVYVVYKLATATDFTFDPVTIETTKGINTFWSDQGNTELTYYKDGYGFTSVTVHKETPDGEPVEQTAKLHRIVYGGLVDVINGTCEPKNLFDLNNANLVDGYISTTSFNTGNSKAKTIYIPINANTTYTVSKTAGQRFQIATSDVIPTNGATYTERVAQSGQQTSLTITSGSNDKYLWAWVFLQDTDTGTLADMLSSVQIEKGSSASEYVPGFTPFTFPPISMETDEGENTLYADQGDSAIVYRKAVD